MTDLIRDAPIGQLIRYITRNRVLLYPEERPDFNCPETYSHPDAAEKAQQLEGPSPASGSVAAGASENAASPVEDPADVEKAHLEAAEDDPPLEAPAVLNRQELERMDTAKSDLHGADAARRATTSSTLGRVSTKLALSQSRTQADLEAAYTAAYAESLTKEPSRAIIPQRTSEGDILVDWYTTDDPENPQVRFSTSRT